MKRETHLTTQEKIMNMEKLGTVSALGVRPPKLMKPNNGGASRARRNSYAPRSGIVSGF